MIINSRDSERLDSFIEQTRQFLTSQSKGDYYREDIPFDPSSGMIEMLNGEKRVANSEDVFVLDNEFRSFIIGILIKYIDLLMENLGNPLFGLGERTLYEFIIEWVFITIHPEVKSSQVNRLKSLLFAGYYKHVDSDPTAYNRYLAGRKHFLTTKDIDALNTKNFEEINDYVWGIITGAVGTYDKKNRKVMDDLIGKVLYKHQSMRVHANPFALNEMLGDIDRTPRHRLVIAFYLRQIIEYFKESHPDEYKRLKYRFDKFWNNSKIQLD